ncbi:hypothetical protein OX284_002820 [Flavobacterium sp. SUN046]|uniref:hypothetical protein n=1 Tax=Flavobacterium sp. SUN046 TaxID=3002440 RepID=UPI002DBE6114|nr:hypothetical protein [Flavobacterium sp. SUN046]MEC4048348.1 hypothetical protein [Flavobacterium sp. SUN046]
MVVSQYNSLKDYEVQLKKGLGEDQEFKKQLVDLNNDHKEDAIYLFSCGEPNCVVVLLNDTKGYIKAIEEQCFNYNLWQLDSDTYQLDFSLYHCCGESPFVSKRAYHFESNRAVLIENYVIINDDYVGNTKLTIPNVLSKKTYYITNSVQDYNLRFSPSIDLLDKNLKESFTFGCEEGTNIISKIKLKSTIAVLAELIQADRVWLFVEIEGSSLNEKCNPVDFDFEHQKIRGWISNKFVTKL